MTGQSTSWCVPRGNGWEEEETVMSRKRSFLPGVLIHIFRPTRKRDYSWDGGLWRFRGQTGESGRRGGGLKRAGAPMWEVAKIEVLNSPLWCGGSFTPSHTSCPLPPIISASPSPVLGRIRGVFVSTVPMMSSTSSQGTKRPEPPRTPTPNPRRRSFKTPSSHIPEVRHVFLIWPDTCRVSLSRILITKHFCSFSALVSPFITSTNIPVCSLL